MTVPYGADGSMIERDADLQHFQWHYSVMTLTESQPAGLEEKDRTLLELDRPASGGPCR